MHRRNLDLIGAICFVMSGMVWVLLPIRPLLVGVLLAVPLVFFLPGYTLTQVLFPRRAAGTPSDSSQALIPGRDLSSCSDRQRCCTANSVQSVGKEVSGHYNNLAVQKGIQPRLKISQPFSTADYIVFSLGLSLVIDIVTGLLLNLLPGGLQWQSWTLSLAMITAVFALLAIFLRRRQPAKQTGASEAHSRIVGAIPCGRPGLYTGFGGPFAYSRGDPLRSPWLLGLALGVVMLALWLSIIRPPQPQPSFTQFWMLPSMQANKSCAVLIGVHNFEVKPETYRIQVMRNGIQIASWPSIMLVPQQEWDRLVPISPPTVRGDVAVDARLYRLDQPGTIYREVHVTLHRCWQRS